MAWFKDAIAAAWRFSRTVFLNVCAVAVMLGGELLAFATTFDWASVISNPRVVGYVLIGVNLANIWLRMITTTPVGGKTED